MPPKDLAIVILAAGKGTRLKSNLAKVLHQAGGRTLSIEQAVLRIVRAARGEKEWSMA